mgnify:CR=1 FL=1
MVKIDIKRTGFPVNVGGLELWFDSSIENLKNFVNVEEIARERIKEIAEQAKHIHFPDEINEETVQDVEGETIEDAFSVSKEYIAVQYDVIFGDGTFKKLYEMYPDVFALENAFDLVAEGIAERLEEENKIRAKKYEETKLSLLDKKKQKKK